ncbi:ABC transporter substrate-binding protein [Pararhizobium mangrovi]|uniref:ABC transporter substrate-binding protein n=1 Tax=Pararhizobium mangrovi TaxID=2590452 RepID=A0A506U3T2_9HYPH|nr:extracellular solute-binding protein [Pararhizobium mangrovi]TPW28108.1 hypothetical protein FJU11_10100 [Pararhizobium mangrovi]
MTKFGAFSLFAAAGAMTLVATTAFAADKYYDAAVAEAKKIAEGKQLSGTIEMISQNSGAEGQTLQDVYKAFTDATGVDVRFTGTPDYKALVASRIQAGNPPDVAEITLGDAVHYAKEGKVVDLKPAFGDMLQKNFNEMLLKSATVDGKMIGVFQGMNPFMVWYNPKAYTGPNPPKNWQALVDYTDAEAKKGNTTWCAAQGAGAASGFPGSQMIENIFLKKYGPELYNKWGRGELAWTSPQVKDAFEEFNRVIAGKGHLQGGRIGAISTSISTGYNGLTASPPTCQLVLWAAWVPGLIGDTAKPGDNIDFFRMPPEDPKFANYEMYQSAIVIGFSDRPETKAFLEFAASTAAQTYLASLNRWPVANSNVPIDAYPSPLLRKIAKTYFGNSDVQFVAGPNVLKQGDTGTAVWKGVVTYMQDPSKLDSVLQSIQDTIN